MKTRYAVALAVVVCFGLGAVAVQGLHAQAKPPVYCIAEIDVTNVEAYTKEHVPRAQVLIKASGGRLLAAGQKVTAIEGAPPKPRVAVQVWDSMENIQAWRNSPGRSPERRQHERPSGRGCPALVPVTAT